MFVLKDLQDFKCLGYKDLQDTRGLDLCVSVNLQQTAVYSLPIVNYVYCSCWYFWIWILQTKNKWLDQVADPDLYSSDQGSTFPNAWTRMRLNLVLLEKFTLKKHTGSYWFICRKKL